MNRSELFKKYDIPGPRYTSYPTVPYWEQSPTEEEWIRSLKGALSEARAENRGGALYVHLPFCKSLCTYCGCNTRITRNNAVSAPYVQTVLKEFDLYVQKLGKYPLSEMHFGGGTPTFLTPEELETLIKGIFERAEVQKDHEFSIEADPRVTTQAHLETLARLGFRRLSLGIQDFDPKVQDIVNRTQSEDEVRIVVESARRLGFTSINFDLIYGLPFQNLKSISDTVDAVRRLRPDRIAFYGYAHVPWIKPSQRRFTEDDLPQGDAKRALYELGRKMLEEAGYLEVGMDHFALPSDSLLKASVTGDLHRNFMGYISKKVSPLLGLGVSSISDSWTVFMQNEKLLETYRDRIEKGELPIHRGHVLTDEDIRIRKMILSLMTRFEASWTSDFSDHSMFSELERDGLLTTSDAGLKITNDGRAFLRNICMHLDLRLKRKAPQTQLFSRTV